MSIEWAPYVLVTTKTTINGDVVWYKNKWKNFFLKIKHIFWKPKKFKKLTEKKLISSKYSVIKCDEKL